MRLIKLKVGMVCSLGLGTGLLLGDRCTSDSGVRTQVGPASHVAQSTHFSSWLPPRKNGEIVGALSRVVGGFMRSRW